MGIFKQRLTPKVIDPSALRKKQVKNKPCPMCGGQPITQKDCGAETFEEANQAYVKVRWWVRCETNDCIALMRYFDTEEQALEAWNTRTVLTCTKETAGEGETHWYRCSNCKHAIDPGAYFCSLCGAKVVKS